MGKKEIEEFKGLLSNKDIVILNHINSNEFDRLINTIDLINIKLALKHKMDHNNCWLIILLTMCIILITLNMPTIICIGLPVLYFIFMIFKSGYIEMIITYNKVLKTKITKYKFINEDVNSIKRNSRLLLKLNTFISLKYLYKNKFKFKHIIFMQNYIKDNYER